MGTIPYGDDETIALPDGRRIRISSFTTTGDLSMGSDGTVWVEGKISDGSSFCLTMGIAEHSEGWMRRFGNALAHHADFADSLVGDDAETRSMKVPAAPDRDGGAVGRLRKKGGKAKFGDFVALKSGRDEFSSMKLDALVEAVGAPEVEEIRATFAGLGSDQSTIETAKTIRWMLRGLPLKMALRKTEVDREVTLNKIGGRRSR
jgi:hypothetical protein